jgi:hypothetical protein
MQHAVAHSDMRRASRFPVDYLTLFEAANGREFHAKLMNISARGFMMSEQTEMEKGDRIFIRLPHVGRIEAFLIWSHEGRSGFEFERVIRESDFYQLIDTIVKK